MSGQDDRIPFATDDELAARLWQLANGWRDLQSKSAKWAVECEEIARILDPESST